MRAISCRDLTVHTGGTGAVLAEQCPVYIVPLRIVFSHGFAIVCVEYHLALCVGDIDLDIDTGFLQLVNLRRKPAQLESPERIIQLLHRRIATVHVGCDDFRQQVGSVDHDLFERLTVAIRNIFADPEGEQGEPGNHNGGKHKEKAGAYGHAPGVSEYPMPRWVQMGFASGSISRSLLRRLFM